MKLGIIVFANDSGLGAQTRRLTYMLRPDRILAINSSGFSSNKKQNFNWYSEFRGYKTDGFPNNREIEVFCKNLTHVLVCENPLNFYLLTYAKRMGIKVFIQSNFEFCDHLNRDIELPHKFLMPSYWKLEEMKKMFGKTLVEYLPPPIFTNEFLLARQTNLERDFDKPRFLHVIGTLASHDRNGTLDLIGALKKTTSSFELVIKSQHVLPVEYVVNDHRVSYVMENINDQQDLYSDFDAVILPRRYGGLSLVTNEALMSGLPVIMPDISPNNMLLPKKWLTKAKLKGNFTGRSKIDIYETEARHIARKIDWLCNTDLTIEKLEAFEIGYNNFSETVLKPKYNEVLK